MRMFVFILTLVGVYLTFSDHFPSVCKAAAKALELRSGRKLTQSELIIRRLADKVEPYIQLDEIKSTRLKSDLQSIGRDITPERFKAETISAAFIYSVAVTWLIPLSPIVGIGACVLMFYAVYSGAANKLRREIEERQQKIERELPQFAGTIRQGLNSTRDIVQILESYRKVCGTALLGEIEITLNDIKMGNVERALKNLESRVSSTKFSELTRGLMAVHRGDDQRSYFDVLTINFTKAQNEEIKKELLKRPSKLKPNNALLLCCMLAMFIVAIGYFVVSQFGLIF